MSTEQSVFYNFLCAAASNFANKPSCLIVAGDMNARPPFQCHNDSLLTAASERLSDLKEQLSLVDQFSRPKCATQTFTFQERTLGCTLDYVLVASRWKSSLEDYCVLNRPCKSDHKPLVCRLKFRFAIEITEQS